MKIQRLTCLVFFLAMVFKMHAQKNGWGATASVIYASNGDLVNEAIHIKNEKGHGGAGFNVGVFGNLNFGPIYLRPKLVYTETSTKYNLSHESSEKFKLKTLDLPILVGIQIIKPISFVVGPAFNYIIDSDLEGLNLKNINNDVTAGLNVGVAIIIGRLGIDLIYERGFSENEASFIDQNIVDATKNKYTLDTRPQQILVSLSYRLSGNKK